MRKPERMHQKKWRMANEMQVINKPISEPPTLSVKLGAIYALSDHCNG